MQLKISRLKLRDSKVKRVKSILERRPAKTADRTTRKIRIIVGSAALIEASIAKKMTCGGVASRKESVRKDASCRSTSRSMKMRTKSRLIKRCGSSSLQGVSAVRSLGTLLRSVHGTQI